MFAQSFWGDKQTLTMQCQGLGDDLPSLRQPDRSQHMCIVMDEVHTGLLSGGQTRRWGP